MAWNGSRSEVALVTGGSGFLGQHMVKHLLKDETVREIRILDKVRWNNILDLPEGGKPVVYLEADLYDKEKCRGALRGVDVVLHCAALVSYDFPPDVEALHRNNVAATKNLLELCVEESVPRLVHCSTTEVTLQSYVRGGIVAMVVYSQESRAPPPDDENRLILREYATSKLRAERIVLAADGTPLKNGGTLRTVSLRPPLLYGEGDLGCVWQILKVAKKQGNSLVRVAGVGGKQEMAYVGNMAWAFICAKNALARCPDGIGGLPVFVTDDTTVENLLRFCERLTRNSNHHVTLSWSIPIVVSYICAVVAELAIAYLPFFRKKLPISPRSLIAYLGSMILHNRSRAAIHIGYTPIFTRDEALRVSSAYYSKVFN
ncbi:3 beta-hydroxysteroid dehydrogenase/Delta 5--_4-isomerase type 4 isoform X3 [Neodiprion virginianus]|uniref:3 beta-hydroxysteroid dehydrogenase/Delta 5-->4-isomerase type 4 isoform X3 n=1 Tax=Neodiprion virginianus TaxID=2961670 RepID=UPI001EE748FB|nr:3 beta-hydroxysteroid dehydrogenase/Delta 5-->4-isomerase type 4 isoform X3 [Neodiprion virginianus]